MNETESHGPPHWVILAGPNGSGKSTTAKILLPPTITFVNADMIAQEITGLKDTAADLVAGRMLVNLLDELEADRADFAVETTLATRKFVPRMERLKSIGYETHLIFMFVESPELAVERVRARVRMGGHNVPEETVLRRYYRGINLFFDAYMDQVDTWKLYDNSRLNDPVRIASGGKTRPLFVNLPEKWQRIHELAGR